MSGRALSYLFPPDSCADIYFLENLNLWMDSDGETYLDLKEFGFSAHHRNTILLEIFRHHEAEYMIAFNNYGELIEIFWEKRDSND